MPPKQSAEPAASSAVSASLAVSSSAASSSLVVSSSLAASSSAASSLAVGSSTVWVGDATNTVNCPGKFIVTEKLSGETCGNGHVHLRSGKVLHITLVYGPGYPGSDMCKRQMYHHICNALGNCFGVNMIGSISSLRRECGNLAVLCEHSSGCAGSVIKKPITAVYQKPDRNNVMIQIQVQRTEDFDKEKYISQSSRWLANSASVVTIGGVFAICDSKHDCESLTEKRVGEDINPHPKKTA